MKKLVSPVAITILGKEYKVACEADEADALLDSAKELDQQMRKIRDSGKVASPDRIAVMAALNLAHELRQLQGKTQPASATQPDGIAGALIKMRQRIEAVLESA